MGLEFGFDLSLLALLLLLHVALLSVSTSDKAGSLGASCAPSEPAAVGGLKASHTGLLRAAIAALPPTPCPWGTGHCEPVCPGWRRWHELALNTHRCTCVWEPSVSGFPLAPGPAALVHRGPGTAWPSFAGPASPVSRHCATGCVSSPGQLASGYAWLYSSTILIIK